MLTQSPTAASLFFLGRKQCRNEHADSEQAGPTKKCRPCATTKRPSARAVMQKGYPSQTAHVNISKNTILRTTARQTRPAARCSAAGEYVASGSGEDTHPMGSASISGYSAVCGAVSGAPNAPPPTVARTVSFAAIQGWRRVRHV